MKEINKESFKIVFDKGIVQVLLTKGYEISLDNVKSLNEAINDIKSEDKRYPILIDGRYIKSISEEARDYLMDEDSNVHTLKAALLVKTALSSFLMNFFVKTNRGPIPHKIFSNKKDAIQWLKQE
jgi:hypothetical protein